MVRFLFLLPALLRAISIVEARIQNVVSRDSISTESVSATTSKQDAAEFQTIQRLDQEEEGDNSKIWRPKVGSTFQVVLSGIVEPNRSTIVPSNAEVWDVDLFDSGKETVTALKKHGKKVICYFSAGTAEDWRPDFKEFPAETQGSKLPLWPGEHWLDIRKENIVNIMKKRIKYASEIGCDAVDPDNMDGYSNERGGGFRRPLSRRDTIKYMRKLSKEAHRYGMSVGLKNAEEILSRVIGDIDFAVNESCGSESRTREPCRAYKALLQPSTRGGWGRSWRNWRNGRSDPVEKAVFHIEYARREPIYASPEQSQVEPGVTTEGTLDEGEGPTIAGWELSLSTQSGRRKLSTPAIRDQLCLKGVSDLATKMSTVIKQMNLDGWVMYCDGRAAITKIRDPSHGHLPPASYGTPIPGIDHGVRYSVADPTYLKILAEPDEPFDEKADRELEAELDQEDEWEREDGLDPELTAERTGAVRDKRPSPILLAQQPDIWTRETFL